MKLLRGQSVVFNQLLVELRQTDDRALAVQSLGAIRGHLQAHSPPSFVYPLSNQLDKIGRILRLGKLRRPARLRFLLPTLNLAIGFNDGLAANSTIQEFVAAVSGAPYFARRECVIFVIGNAPDSETLERLLAAFDLSDCATKDAVQKAAKEFETESAFRDAALFWEALAQSDTALVWAHLNAIRNWVAVNETERAKSISQRVVPSEAETSSLAHMVRTMRSCRNYDGEIETIREIVRRADKGELDLDPEKKRELIRQFVNHGDFQSADRISPKELRQNQLSRFVILDPGHTDGAGHHAIYNHFFADVIGASTGEPPDIVIGRHATGLSLEGREVIKSMLYAPYTNSDDLLDPRAFDGMSRFLKAELDNLFAEGIPDVLVLHTLTGRMLPSVMSWLKGLGRARPRLLILGILDANLSILDSLEDKRPEVLKEAFETLSELSGTGSIIFAETSAKIDWLLSKAPALSVRKFPYLAAERMMHLPKRDTEQPTFGILGGTRQERGIETILQVIETATDEVRWLVQVDGKMLSLWDQDASERLGRIRAQERTEITFLDGFLLGTGFEDAFAQLDVLVLPYSGRYAMSGSGVLWEAIYGRKALLISEETTLSTELDAIGYPYLSIPADDPVAIAKAVAEMSRNWRETKAAIAAFHESQPILPADEFRTLLSKKLSELGAVQ